MRTFIYSRPSCCHCFTRDFLKAILKQYRSVSNLAIPSQPLNYQSRYHKKHVDPKRSSPHDNFFEWFDHLPRDWDNGQTEGAKSEDSTQPLVFRPSHRADR